MRELKKKQEIADIWEKYPLQEYFSFPIRPHTRVVEFESEELIFDKDEKPEILYFLYEGRAKLFLPDDRGRILLIDFLESPCFVGEMELIGAQERAQSVQAVTRCRCFLIEAAACREELLQDAVFLKKLCVQLGQKTRRNTENYVRNQAYSLERRLATFVLLTMHHDMYTERHTEAAEYLGVTYRHLLYVLAQFRRQGILEKTPQGYRILDLDALKELEIR